MMKFRGFTTVLLAAGVVAAGFAQGHVANDLYFQSKIGSLKALGNAGDPAKGTLIISFRGSLLVSRATPGTKITLSEGVRKEKEDIKHGKVVYFGHGTLKLEGGFDAVQFFGKDVNGEFHGKAFFRFYGEFDQNLDTGFYWFSPGTKKKDWGTGGIGIPIPYDLKYAEPEVSVRPNAPKVVPPKVEVKKGKG